MNYKTSILAISFMLLLGGCNDQETSTGEKVVKNPFETAKEKAAEAKVTHKEVVNNNGKVYTMDEIYNAMCIECHSADGSGNTQKLTPSMKSDTEAEIFTALKDVEDDNGHIVMEHNREKIIKKGMEYKADEMASYMFNRFNQK